jgi:hypothetical protein
MNTLTQSKELIVRRIDGDPMIFFGTLMHKPAGREYKSLIPLWERDGWTVIDLG